MIMKTVKQRASIPFQYILLAAFAVTLLSGAEPAPAKDRWFDNPVQQRQPRGARNDGPAGTQRESFVDPVGSNKPMFGPATARNLEAAIRRYEAFVAAGGWPRIPKGPGLGLGSVDERVSLIRRHLIATGDLPRSAGIGHKYLSFVVEGVKRFQMRHGLKPTGRVYGSTLAALNIPAKQRLAQLRLNLERVRKISRQLKGKRYIVVNIPAYELQAIDRGRVKLYSRVITGKSSTPTPVTATRIRALNFYPYWNVPQSIATRALVPKVTQDPGYLARERIRVFAGKGAEVDTTKVSWTPSMGRRYVFRQDPGPGNALGVIRLDMPNKYTVYMHDTPLQRLFRYGVRPYSAGCIRVHKIFDLSAWLLQEKGGWSRSRVMKTVAAARAETVTLPRPVPVYLVYVTAWGLPDGTAQFRVDIYNRDGTDRVTAEIEGSKADVSALTP